jgi:hypothetical protein
VTVPTKDAERRTWYPFFNLEDEEVPPHSVVSVIGKRGWKEFSRRALPDDYGAPNTHRGAWYEEPTWRQLQEQVGFGNACLVGGKPGNINGTYTLPNAHGFTGPVATPPRSWGRITFDTPAIARVRGVDMVRGTLPGPGYRLSWDRWVIVNHGSWWLTNNMRDKHALGSVGWWSGYRAFALPDAWYIMDMIETFDDSSGLAWVQYAQRPPRATSGTFTSVGLTAEEGLSYPVLETHWNYSGFEGFENQRDLIRLGIRREQGFFEFRQPGLYRIATNITTSASVSGSERPEGGENPYAYVNVRWTPEWSENAVRSYREFFDTGTTVTLAPPLLKAAGSATPAEYVTHHLPWRTETQVFIPAPPNYDPARESRDWLFRTRPVISRTSNMDSLYVYCNLSGEIAFQGVGPQPEFEEERRGP